MVDHLIKVLIAGRFLAILSYSKRHVWLWEGFGVRVGISQFLDGHWGSVAYFLGVTKIPSLKSESDSLRSWKCGSMLVTFCGCAIIPKNGITLKKEYDSGGFFLYGWHFKGFPAKFTSI